MKRSLLLIWLLPYWLFGFEITFFDEKITPNSPSFRFIEPIWRETVTAPLLKNGVNYLFFDIKRSGTLRLFSHLTSESFGLLYRLQKSGTNYRVQNVIKNLTGFDFVYLREGSYLLVANFFDHPHLFLDFFPDKTGDCAYLEGRECKKDWQHAFFYAKAYSSIAGKIARVKFRLSETAQEAALQDELDGYSDELLDWTMFQFATDYKERLNIFTKRIAIEIASDMPTADINGIQFDTGFAFSQIVQHALIFSDLLAIVSLRGSWKNYEAVAQQLSNDLRSIYRNVKGILKVHQLKKRANALFVVREVLRKWLRDFRGDWSLTQNFVGVGGIAIDSPSIETLLDAYAAKLGIETYEKGYAVSLLQDIAKEMEQWVDFRMQLDNPYQDVDRDLIGNRIDKYPNRAMERGENTTFPGHSPSGWTNYTSFAALGESGRAVTWGAREWGGDSRGVSDALYNVKRIYSTQWAYAALKEDGRVVTWGLPSAGGDSQSVQEQLRNVKEIASTTEAFAALREDGSVVTWGNSLRGGDSSKVQLLLHNVKKIYSNRGAFAALREDGSVVCWGSSYDENGMDSWTYSWTGEPLHGHDLSEIPPLKGVKEIVSSWDAFAALMDDGSVRAWGDGSNGGMGKYVAGFKKVNGVEYPIMKDVSTLRGVQKIAGNDAGFAALLENGDVVVWGGISSDKPLKNVKEIFATYGTFAFLREDGTAFFTRYGSTQLKNIKTIFANDSTFVLLRKDGTIESIPFDSQVIGIKDVEAVYATEKAFAALKKDGSVVTWGDGAYGGDSSKVAKELHDIEHIVSTGRGFCALRSDGVAISWGSIWGEGADAITFHSTLPYVAKLYPSPSYLSHPLHYELLFERESFGLRDDVKGDWLYEYRRIDCPLTPVARGEVRIDREALFSGEKIQECQIEKFSQHLKIENSIQNFASLGKIIDQSVEYCYWESADEITCILEKGAGILRMYRGAIAPNISTYKVALERYLKGKGVFSIDGSFYLYDFNEDGKIASNDFFYRTSEGTFYRLLGAEPSSFNPFGFKKVDINSFTLSQKPLGYFCFIDFPRDRESRFSWIFVSRDGKVYKLMGVTEQNSFRYLDNDGDGRADELDVHAEITRNSIRFR